MNLYKRVKDSYERIREKYLEGFRQERRESFWKTIPLTQVEWFPNSGNEGLYGYTYRLSGKIAMNERLKGDYSEKIDTDMHESGHTNDEHETREKTKLRMRWLFPEEKDYLVGLVLRYEV